MDFGEIISRVVQLFSARQEEVCDSAVQIQESTRFHS